MASPYTNVHTHAARPGAGLEVVNLSLEALEQGLMTHRFASAGVHPWHADAVEEQLTRLQRQIRNPNLAAIGECGLDRLCQTPFERQQECFIAQIALAEQAGKPLIVHCVKAFNELIRLKKLLRISVPVIVHGYNNNPEIAGQLANYGFYLSFGKALLKPASNAATVIGLYPGDRIFLETDDSAAVIDEIFMAAAIHLKTGVDRLQEKLMCNFNSVFGAQ